MNNIKRIISALLVCVMILSLAGCAGKKNAKPGDGYADTLFDASYVHKINVDISSEDWQDLTSNPMNKTKYSVDITIDGEKVENVAFSAKGNTSLTAVAGDPDSDRYSFKVNFGKFVKGRNYRGLNKLSLNNIYADATYMKDYLSYELFRQVGVEAPLVSYVMLSINGSEHGLYLAIEDVSESYLERTANGAGELYKPETEQLSNMAAGKDGQNSQPPQGGGSQQAPDASGMPQMPDGSGMPQMPGGFDPSQGGFPSGFDPSQGGMPGGFDPSQGGMPGGFGSSDNGASLVYTDDELESYTDIFNNDETNADEASKLRVIAALKGLSEGTDVEKYVDTDEVIRYFAAHNFVLNYDSYTGMMLHNYYLYENEGKLSMLPWDYNLGFGAFAMGAGGDATALINTGIDTPLSGATAEKRPMWAFIANSEEYLARYHEVYSELISNYFDSGEFEKQIDALYKMILPYVKKDPSAFYTADEFKTAYKTLKSFCLLRAESIKKQLSGALSADSSAQSREDMVDASDVNVASMGSNNMGGGQTPGGQGFPGGQGCMTPPNGQGGMTPPGGQGGMTPPNGQGGMNPPGGQGEQPAPSQRP